MRWVLVVVVAALGLHCSSGDPSEGETPAQTVDSAQALRVNGGETGAMVRDVTPHGYTCIDSSITLPDYNPDPCLPAGKAGDPWIYYGFSSDTGTTDLECGLAFQKGDPALNLAHRWRPYIKWQGSFYFAPESNSVYPGNTVDLRCSLRGGAVTMTENGAPVGLRGGSLSGTRTSFPLGLNPAGAHVRRVVGNAWDFRKNGPYHGQRMGTVGPVTYQNTVVCKAAGGTVPFQGSVASWKSCPNGGQCTEYGTAHVPGGHTVETHSGGTDTVTLFPNASCDAGAGEAGIDAGDASIDVAPYPSCMGRPDGPYCGRQLFEPNPDEMYQCVGGELFDFGPCLATQVCVDNRGCVAGDAGPPPNACSGRPDGLYCGSDLGAPNGNHVYDCSGGTPYDFGPCVIGTCVGGQCQ